MITRRTLLKSACLLPALQPLSLLAAHAQAKGEAIAPEKKTENAPWLEEIALQLQKQFNLPAVWVAANIEDRVEGAVVGVRKYGDPTLATLDDHLMVGSISKPMAGLWIATLAAQGKITYDTKVLDVLPELKATCLPEHQDILLGHLLTHTAGLVRDPKNIPTNLTLDQYPAERLREAKELLATPGLPNTKGKESYSNAGFDLAISMAERVVGEPFEDAAGRFHRERLGLKSWGVWPMDRPEDLSQPWPHAMKNGTPAPQPPAILAHYMVEACGSAHCTIEDLARFGLIVTNATRLSQTILTPSDWTTVLGRIPNTTHDLLSLFTKPDQMTFTHTGSVLTSCSSLLVIPEWRASFAAYSNCAVPQNFYEAAVELLQDPYRKRRAQGSPIVPCTIAITGLELVDTEYKNIVIPKLTDEKICGRIKLRVDTPTRTGDLKIWVKVGDREFHDNRYFGMRSGDQTSLFTILNPKTKTIPVEVKIDALGISGNTTPEAASYKTIITLA